MPLKKFFCLLFSMCLILSFITGCGKVTCHKEYEGTLPQIPFLEDDTENESPLGLYDGSAFGIVEQTCDHGITLIIQNQSFFFKWTDRAKKAYERFGINVGDEIAIPVDSDETSYVAKDVEKVM